jgi:hypothetical protein
MLILPWLGRQSLLFIMRYTLWRWCWHSNQTDFILRILSPYVPHHPCFIGPALHFLCVLIYFIYIYIYASGLIINWTVLAITYSTSCGSVSLCRGIMYSSRSTRAAYEYRYILRYRQSLRAANNPSVRISFWETMLSCHGNRVTIPRAI